MIETKGFSLKSCAYRLLILNFLTYLTAYLMRTNFAAALPLIGQQMLLTEAQLGIVGSAFFIFYSIGQLMNGFIADAVNPYKFIIFATIGAVASNLSMACSRSLWMFVLFWACNGYFQSIFWGSMQRILSLHFGDEKHTMVATTMSSSMVAGFIASWVVLKNLLHGRSWQGFFFWPAVCGIAILVLWIIALRRQKENAPNSQAKLSWDTVRNSLKRIARKHLFVVCLVCLCLGFIKESISVWGPTMIAELLGASLQGSSLVLFFIPIGNFFGIFLAKFLADRRKENPFYALSIMFFSILACAALLLVFHSRTVLLTVLLIVLVSAMSYGCNSVLLSMIPLHYTKDGIVSTLIGLFDFSSYTGAAISSVIAGVLFSAGQWHLLALLWLIFAVLALIFLVVSRKKVCLC